MSLVTPPNSNGWNIPLTSLRYGILSGLPHLPQVLNCPPQLSSGTLWSDSPTLRYLLVAFFVFPQVLSGHPNLSVLSCLPHRSLGTLLVFSLPWVALWCSSPFLWVQYLPRGLSLFRSGTNWSSFSPCSTWWSSVHFIRYLLAFLIITALSTTCRPSLSSLKYVAAFLAFHHVHCPHYLTIRSQPRATGSLRSFFYFPRNEYSS